MSAKIGPMRLADALTDGGATSDENSGGSS